MLSIRFNRLHASKLRSNAAENYAHIPGASRKPSSCRIRVRLDVMNLFNAVNFTPVAQTGAGATINQVTAAYTDMSQTWDPGGRLGQVVFRFNW